MIKRSYTIAGAIVPVAILSLIFVTLLGSCVNPSDQPPMAKEGRLSLENWSFSDREPVPLNGEWSFYPGAFIEPGAIAGPRNAIYAQLPESGLWHTVRIGGKPLSIYGYASYRLTLSLSGQESDLALRVPEFFSASRIFLNGQQIFSAGTPGVEETRTEPRYRTGYVRINPVAGDNELVVHIANYRERRGGVNRSLYVGREGAVKNMYNKSLAMDLIVFGSLITIGIYHLCLFWLRKKDRSPLWFGIFCIIIALRSLIYGERFAFDLFPGVPWSVFNRIDHLTFYLGIPIFSAYLALIFERNISKIAITVYQALGIVFALFLFFPPSVYNVTVLYYEIITGVYALYILFIIGQALVRRYEGAMTTMIGIAIFLCFGINEILFNMGIIHTFNSLSVGLVLFLFTQSVLLAMRFSKAFDESEHLGRSLLNMNESLRRFIPQEFFLLLKRREVDEIRLGDQVEHSMSIMFSDIRRFTLLAEQMGAAKTFEFLNDYFGRIGEVIRRNGGFIDKYLGDGFIALFPSSPDSALRTAIGIQQVVNEFNRTRLSESMSSIEVGIGLNFGPLILGTVGEEHRMDTTVIADSVNLCSRLEGLCKMYGTGIIVPFEFLDLLEDPTLYHWRYLGLIRVQGRKQPVETVHIYDGLPEKDFAMFEATKSRFEEGLHHYRNGDYEQAMSMFRALASEAPDDPAVFTFISQIHRLMTSGLIDDWDGIENAPAK